MCLCFSVSAHGLVDARAIGDSRYTSINQCSKRAIRALLSAVSALKFISKALYDGHDGVAHTHTQKALADPH